MTNPLLTTHVVIEKNFSNEESLLNKVRMMLFTKYSINHTTIQLERVDADSCGQENCI